MKKMTYFLSIDASVYETLKDNYDDKYEYILPEITLNKNLYSNEVLGNLELQSNLKVQNYRYQQAFNFPSKRLKFEFEKYIF